MLTKVTKRRFASGTRRHMGTNTNRKDGLRFEAELCEKLAEHGWWAHDMAQSAAGQPSDVIAVKNNKAVLIDCKVCASDKFQLSRIEPNQEMAMNLWYERGNQLAYFAVKFSSGLIYMISWDKLKLMKQEQVSCVPEGYFIQWYPLFSQWLFMMKYVVQ